MKEQTEEEILKKHIQGTEKQLEPIIENEKKDLGNTTDIQYFSFDASSHLPCGKFYPQGTMLMVRPAKVKEIQAYAMVDDNNFYDIIEKMNDMLQSCVKVKYADGHYGTFLDIKDQDRIYLIFLIRELTFEQGNSLGVNIKCTCGAENRLELSRKYFRFHTIDEKLQKYYNKATGSFILKTINGQQFELTPPTIGIQKIFSEFIVKETGEKRPPNLAFLKIVPFMIGKPSITPDEIKKRLKDFEDPSIIDDISFQFLNSAVSMMTFGIKELAKPCNVCGVEVHTDMQFPNGASGIFVVYNAFEDYIAK